MKDLSKTAILLGCASCLALAGAAGAQTTTSGSAAQAHGGLAPASPATAPTSAVAAQPNPPATAAGALSSSVQEVVVTAQKRAENVQTVPISMTALSGQSLVNKSVTTLSDLQFAAPSLSVENDGLTQSVNIRGIGLSSGSPNAANGVATYVDGLFQPPIVSGGSYYDLADVEVLRGPQGTFVGSNSTGGAIFINSQSPKLNAFGGYASIGGGTYGSFLAQGAVNVPLGDTLALRLAANYDQHDSYYTDHGPYDDKAGRLGEFDYRAGLLWNPVKFYQATFKLESVEKDTGGYAYQPVPGTFYGGSNPSNASWSDLYYNTPTANNERAIQGGLTQQFTLPGDIILKSITGLQNKQIHNLYDTDATEVADLTENQFVRERVGTQEIDILSPTNRRLSWIVGGYFQRNRIDVVIADGGGLPTNILIHDEKTTFGGFGQVTYQLAPTLVATVGLRYSTYAINADGYVKVGDGLPGFPPGGLYVANPGGQESDDAVTGKANLDWTFAPNNLLYVFAARGYKSGGINTPTTNFLPETVWDYELGWKSTLLDGHLKTQLDGFYNDYDNFQSDTVNTTTGQSALQNIPTAKIYGIEAQAQARIGGLQGDAAFAFVHSRLGDYKVIDQNLLPPGSLLPQCAAGQTADCTDYTNATKDITDAPNLLSPEFTFNGGVQYAVSLPSDFTVTPRLNYSYQSSQYASPSLDPFYKIASRSLVSALLSVSHGPWLGQIRATNMLNKIYVSGFVISGSAGNQFYGSPREIVFTLQRSF